MSFHVELPGTSATGFQIIKNYPEYDVLEHELTEAQAWCDALKGALRQLVEDSHRHPARDNSFLAVQKAAEKVNESISRVVEESFKKEVTE